MNRDNGGSPSQTLNDLPPSAGSRSCGAAVGIGRTSAYALAQRASSRFRYCAIGKLYRVPTRRCCGCWASNPRPRRAAITRTVGTSPPLHATACRPPTSRASIPRPADWPVRARQMSRVRHRGRPHLPPEGLPRHEQLCLQAVRVQRASSTDDGRPARRERQADARCRRARSSSAPTEPGTRTRHLVVPPGGPDPATAKRHASARGGHATRETPRPPPTRSPTLLALAELTPKPAAPASLIADEIRKAIKASDAAARARRGAHARPSGAVDDRRSPSSSS